MTLKGKLLAGFITVAIIAGVIGGVGIYNVRKIDAADTMLFERVAVPLGDIAQISTYFQKLRINGRDIVAATTSADRDKFAERIKTYREAIEKHAEAFEKTIISDEGRRMFEDFKKTRLVYGPMLDKVITLAREERSIEATALMTTQTINTCIIVVEVSFGGETIVLGVLADSVQEVVEMAPDLIEPPPKIGTRLNTEFIKGMGKVEDNFVMILDIDKVFSQEKLTEFQDSAKL